MAGFSDLIPAAMPFLATEEISAAVGSDWEWSYTVQDNDGANVDMTTGYTGVCEIKDKIGGTLLLAPTVTFPAAGQVKCAATAAQTGPLTPGHYIHEVEITRTSDGKKVKLVGAGRAQFLVLGQVTV